MSQRMRRLLEEQREFVDGMDAAALRRAADLVTESRTDLVERLKKTMARRGEENFSVRILGSLVRQCETVADQLTARMGEDIRKTAGKWGLAGLESILSQVEVMEGPVGALRLELAMGVQGASGLSLKGPLKRYGREMVNRIEGRLAKILIQNLPRQEAVTLLLGTAGDTVLALRSRAALIYRNELSNVYDLDAFRGQKRLHANLTDRGRPGLQARMDEARDRRSHPFSLAAHGVIAAVGDPWRVLLAAIAVFGKVGGMIWPVVGDAYQGDRYIAHHNDRGIRTTWREGWGDPKGV